MDQQHPFWNPNFIKNPSIWCSFQLTDGSTDGSASGYWINMSYHSSLPLLVRILWLQVSFLYFSILPSAACLSASCRLCQVQTYLFMAYCKVPGNINWNNWINCISGCLPLNCLRGRRYLSFPSSQMVWTPSEVLKEKHHPLLLTCLEQGNKRKETRQKYLLG